MRSLGSIVAAQRPASAKAIPGVLEHDRMRLNTAADEAIRDALDRGEDLRRMVLHLEADSVELVLREELARDFEHAGVRSLAKKLRAAWTKPGFVLLLVDADETHLTELPLVAFGEGACSAVPGDSSTVLLDGGAR